MAGRLVHFEVPAKDTGRAKGFYSAVFGWEFGEPMMGMDYNLTQALKFSVGWQTYARISKDAANAAYDYKVGSLLAELGFRF